MNERIKEFAEQAGLEWGPGGHADYSDFDHSLFAELIVKECKENFTKVWYEQGLDIRGAELGKFMTRFEEHFGVEE